MTSSNPYLSDDDDADIFEDPSSTTDEKPSDFLRAYSEMLDSDEGPSPKLGLEMIFNAIHSAFIQTLFCGSFSKHHAIANASMIDFFAGDQQHSLAQHLRHRRSEYLTFNAARSSRAVVDCESITSQMVNKQIEKSQGNAAAVPLDMFMFVTMVRSVQEYLSYMFSKYSDEYIDACEDLGIIPFHGILSGDGYDSDELVENPFLASMIGHPPTSE